VTRPRHAARAVVLDADDRVLLCRFAPAGDLDLWTAPGGGVEPGETVRDVLRRELDEAVAPSIDGNPPHVWHQRVLVADHVVGYDGVVDDYFLVRTERF
jgi:hypothetical protein